MKIIVCDSANEKLISELKKFGNVVYKPENLQVEIENAVIIIVRSATKVNKELLGFAKNIKAVIRAGVGLDNIDVEECKKRGIEIYNTPSASTNAVAEQTIGMIIGLMRGLYLGHEGMKNGKWLKKETVGREIEGKTLGIIGLGRIGSSVAEKANKLGMKIIAYNLNKRESEFIEFVDFEELCQRADIITIHAAMTKETENMINEKSIEKMKQGVYLINMARGQIVDEEALYNGLKNGKISGAALDVYCEEPYKGKLLELSNVFFTPHIGANTIEAQEKISGEIVKIIEELKNRYEK
ncbi:MAG: NAD(P)-dependent oxidoreductase [Candidatus ainarchaeum sp.]|nr:NAD(P)-dependent oxidoreductase [Candidatus ainarchaeum sp.]